MARKHRLQDMTAAEFAERVVERPLVILPFGAQEQQGPHAPMGDFLLADRLAAMIAERSGAVMAPTMPFGESELFRTMPGCVSLRPTTLVPLIEDICTSFLDHGLRHLLILNGQTSNAPLIAQATRALRRSHGVLIPSINLWRLLSAAELEAIYGTDAARAQGHGGDPITSMFLHLAPELVRPDLIVAPQPWKRVLGLATRSGAALDFAGAPIAAPLDIADMSDNGNLSGDGRLASAEIGQRLTERIVDLAAGFIAHFRAADPSASPAR